MANIQKIGVSAFILVDDKLLIVKRAANESFLPNYYEMPGGKIEYGEKPEDALIREVKEETSLDIKVNSPYSTFSYVNNVKNKHTIDIQYICKSESNVNDVKLSEEQDSFELIEEKDIDKYNISDEMKNAIKKGFDFLNKIK
ncbi:DNA mismatch repair protein MutT [Candidatus Parcubacteria bacterium]|nr:MAG: DNA mismatch repair protein MutT [Candidatus Parcubacteria bacterium]